jgi:hypothetical protein
VEPLMSLTRQLCDEYVFSIRGEKFVAGSGLSCFCLGFANGETLS